MRFVGTCADGTTVTVVMEGKEILSIEGVSAEEERVQRGNASAAASAHIAQVFVLGRMALAKNLVTLCAPESALVSLRRHAARPFWSTLNYWTVGPYTSALPGRQIDLNLTLREALARLTLLPSGST